MLAKDNFNPSELTLATKVLNNKTLFELDGAHQKESFFANIY